MFIYICVSVGQAWLSWQGLGRRVWEGGFGKEGLWDHVLWDLLAVCLVVSGSDHYMTERLEIFFLHWISLIHARDGIGDFANAGGKGPLGPRTVRLAAGDGGELSVELLHDGGVRVLAVEQVLRLQQPVIGVAQVARVHDELVVVDGVGETSDRRVVQRRVDQRDRVALGVVRLDRVAVGPVHAQVDDGVEGEGPRVARRPRAQEVLHARVRRRDLVVVRRAGAQARQRHRVPPRPRARVRD